MNRHSCSLEGSSQDMFSLFIIESVVFEQYGILTDLGHSSG